MCFVYNQRYDFSCATLYIEHSTENYYLILSFSLVTLNPSLFLYLLEILEACCCFTDVTGNVPSA